MEKYVKPLPYDMRMDGIMDRVRKSTEALGSQLRFRTFVVGKADWRIGLVDTKGSNITVVGEKDRLSLGIGCEGDVHIWTFPTSQGNLNIGTHVDDGDLIHSHITPDEIHVEFIDDHGALWKVDVDTENRTGVAKRTSRPDAKLKKSEAQLCQ